MMDNDGPNRDRIGDMAWGSCLEKSDRVFTLMRASGDSARPPFCRVGATLDEFRWAPLRAACRRGREREQCRSRDWWGPVCCRMQVARRQQVAASTEGSL